MSSIKKSLLNLCIGASAIAWGGCAVADQGDVWAGVDVLQTNYKMKEGYGKETFGKNPIATNLFVGYDLPKNFYFELGYESHKTKKLDAQMTAYPGSITTASIGMDYANVRTKFSIEQPYFGFGYNFGVVDNISLSALVGLSHTEVKAYLFENVGFAGAAPIVLNTHNNFIQRKTILVSKIGMNYQLTNFVKIRLVGVWHQMSRFKINPNVVNAAGQLEVRPKNAFAAGLGLVYLF